MNIAIFAGAERKNLLQNFCVAYGSILKKHNLFSTETSGLLIEKVTNIHVHKMMAGGLGGEKQLSSMIKANEIDCLILFVDTDLQTGVAHHLEILTACDEVPIPYATNLATAEILVLALERGDLDWRKMI